MGCNPTPVNWEWRFEGHADRGRRQPPIGRAAGVRGDGLLGDNGALAHGESANPCGGARRPENVPHLGAAGQMDLPVAGRFRIGGDLDDPGR